MFYEGAEKKAEIIINQKHMSLLDDIPTSFWHLLVKQCDAQILSVIEKPNCRAYLLSESSLFIWHDRFIILTCGNTRLIRSVLFFIADYKNKIIQLNYQRKSEFSPNLQHSSFQQDIQQLARKLTGNVYYFGDNKQPYHALFQYNSSQQSQLPITPRYHDIEYVAYQISSSSSAFLCQSTLSKDAIRRYLKLEQLLAQFSLDDHVFQPYGYSLNAINEQQYFTIHITPQLNSSYVGIHTNIDQNLDTLLLLKQLQAKIIDRIQTTAEKLNGNEQALTPEYRIQSTHHADLNQLHYQQSLHHQQQLKLTRFCRDD